MDQPQHEGFPLVGIGASAGGIEALEQFFHAMPAKSGLAFVVVTHLPPARESSLVPILANFAPIPVVAAEDGVAVEPDRIHVLSREGTLTIHGGVLRLRAPDPVHRERHPIDVFFASLAEDVGDQAVGIVLSGGGSDGTLGIKAIKEAGGLTLAQSSDHTAPRHSGMPSSAIASGLVDLVLPVQAMPQRLIGYFSGSAPLGQLGEEEQQASELAAERQEICRILRSQVGHDFSGYKQNTFLRRVQRRMQVLQLSEIGAYVERLRRDRDEARLLFRDLLISVTNFFRDKEAFEELERQVIPALLAGKGADEVVRVWVPGCATGEEVYSIAMLLREAEDALGPKPKIQIFATDIDEPALAVARTARYPAALLESVSPERLQRFFTRNGASYVVANELRELCVFSAHSVIRDPPFSRIDLVSCRNLLIYLDADLQSRIIPIFHYALRPGGYLFLGASENITPYGDLFAPLTKKQRVFQRRDHASPTIHFPLFLPGRIGGANAALLGNATRPASRPPNLGTLPLRQAVENRVLERFAPAYVVVNREGDVIYYSARTGKYLEPAAGVPSRQLVGMARKGLRIELRSALSEAIERRRPVRRDSLAVEIDDRIQTVALTIDPLPDHEGDPLFLILFEDVGRPSVPDDAASGGNLRGMRGDSLVEHLETEVRELRDRLQTTIEEYETTLEELKSANEELVSVNEEVQSTNEELETAKEEQQSVNEELHTINSELNRKVEELDRANADLRNLFESTQIATVFLDRQLMIRSFTPAVTAIFNLIPTDRGRPLTDIANQLEGVDLRGDIQRVFETHEPVQRRVRGRPGGSAHYLMRLLPYRGSENTIDGVLVTFVDVSHVVESEEHQRLLVAELNHRVRNMLSVVIGIVTQSAAKEPDMRVFAEHLLDRLHALAGTYALISRENWGPVRLDELVRRELEPYALDENRRRVAVDGIAVSLGPKAALAFGMALHELATNAAKFGSLTESTGRVEVSWSIEGEGNGAGRRLVVRWREVDGPAVPRKRREGFGTALLGRVLNYEVDGEVSVEFAPDGLRAQLVAPVDGDLVRIGDDSGAGTTPRPPA